MRDAALLPGCKLYIIPDLGRCSQPAGKARAMSTEKTLEPGIAVASLPDQEICREALLEKYARGREQPMEGVRSRGGRPPAAAEAPEKQAHGGRRSHGAREGG